MTMVKRNVVGLLLLVLHLADVVAFSIPHYHSPGAALRVRTISGTRLPTKTPRTIARLVPPTNPIIDVSTSSGLVVAALVAWSFDQKYSQSGIPVALSLGCLLATLPCVSTTSPILAMCWDTFVPTSLALLLLSLKESPELNRGASLPDASRYSVLPSIIRLGPSFLFASLGSLLGGILAFLLCLSKVTKAPSLLLPVESAKIALPCLVASFIGGSANFFATALHIKATPQTSHFNPSTTVSAMATTDILIMAIYFAFLSAALSSKRLTRAFKSGVVDEMNDNGTLSSTAVLETNDSCSKLDSPNRQHYLLGVSLALASSLSIVKLATCIERKAANLVPGLACAVIAAFTPVIKRVLFKFLDTPTKTVVTKCSQPLSQISFMLLFVSIGVTADLRNAFAAGPACFIVSLITLAVHILVTFTGSLLLAAQQRRRCLPAEESLDLPDVLVASNAAIGGSFTASAFCGQVSSISPARQKGLTYAATFWGIVGYACGTTIGIWTYRLFHWIS